MIPHSGAEPLGVLRTGTYATYTEELTINTPERYQIVCITNDVEQIVQESGIDDGLVLELEPARLARIVRERPHAHRLELRRRVLPLVLSTVAAATRGSR